MEGLSQRVADRYMVRLAVREVVSAPGFRARTASLQDLTPEVLTAFAEGFLIGEGRTASFGGLVKKLSKLMEFFKKAPKAWEQIKQFLGVKSVTDIPRAIKEWAKKGLDALRKAMSKVKETFPLALYFVPQAKMPGLTDLMHRILAKHPAIAKALAGVKNVAGRIDQWMDKYLPTLRRPLLAAIFIWVWLNVSELTWDMEGLIRGFTGGISFGELLAGLPESGIGFIAALAGLGYGALPVTIIARFLWLTMNRYLEWVPGKGFKVNWDRIGGESARPEFVPVF